MISTVTDAVVAEVTAWQQRPLESMYPVVFFDALRVKIRDDGTVRSKAVYLALGIQADGQRDVLGLWIEQTEGAKKARRGPGDWAADHAASTSIARAYERPRLLIRPCLAGCAPV